MICCLAVRRPAFQFRQFAISALFSEASSGDEDCTDPKAAVSIARPCIPKASRLDVQNVLILLILFLLVSECSEAVGNCTGLHCFMSRIARTRNTNRKMVPFYSILETRGLKSDTPSGLTGEQEPSGPGHCTRNETHRAGTPVNRSHEAQVAAHAKQHPEPAHR